MYKVMFWILIDTVYKRRMFNTNKELASVASGLRRLGDTPKQLAGKLKQYGWCK